MNKYILMIVTSLWFMSHTAIAENQVTINEFRIKAGETKEVSILLHNDEAFVAFQFDLVLPQNIEVVSYSANKNRLPIGTSLSMAQQNDGRYRFVAAAMDSEHIGGNSGAIISLKVRAPEDLSSGECMGYFYNVKLSKADATGETIKELSFPVNVIEPTIVTAVDCSREYGEPNPVFEYIVTGDTIDGQPEIKCCATDSSLVGNYPIVVQQGSITNDYVEYVRGTLTITKAPLTVTVGTYTKKQGEPMPEFIVSFEGFKNGETAKVLTKPVVVNCNADIYSAPGEYTITLSGAEATNYDIQYIAGKLIVTEPKIFNLTYMVDGEEYKKDSVTYNAAITPEAEPTKEGYTFSGWSEIPETMPAHDVTISGTFSLNSYTLTYKVDGEDYKSATVAFGTAITPVPEPTKEGYTFSGWSEIPETMPASDVEVFGTFAINTYAVIYKVDGEEYKTDSVTYNAAIMPETEPTKEGYTFSGWNDIPETMPAHDIVVTGSFTVNSYTVTFMYGDSILAVINVNYGEMIPLPESLDSDRYTLVEWLDVPETMPAHDITIQASFTDGVMAIKNGQKKDEYYRINGEKVNELQKGVNIIHKVDGTIRKVLIN